MNARRPSRAAARLRCLWRRGCSGRRRARPLCVPVCGGPPASRPRCELRSARRLEARPGPAAAHRHRGRPLRCPSHRRRVVADVWWGVLFRFPARPRHRLPAPLQVPPGPSASVALAASAWQFRMQFPDACGQPLCEKPGISTIGFRTMKCIRGNCMRMCADQAVPPRCSALGAKKFALRRCVIAKARKSSPCALKTPQIWCFCACWANLFAERPV